jgi:hypothetical protein
LLETHTFLEADYSRAVALWTDVALHPVVAERPVNATKLASKMAIQHVKGAFFC